MLCAVVVRDISIWIFAHSAMPICWRFSLHDLLPVSSQLISATGLYDKTPSACRCASRTTTSQASARAPQIRASATHLQSSRLLRRKGFAAAAVNACVARCMVAAMVWRHGRSASRSNRHLHTLEPAAWAADNAFGVLMIYLLHVSIFKRACRLLPGI